MVRTRTVSQQLSPRPPTVADQDIHRLGTQSYHWVWDTDIEACFDMMDHTALRTLMERVRARVKDKRVLGLVKGFLNAGIMIETGGLQDSDTGTPRVGSCPHCWLTLPSACSTCT